MSLMYVNEINLIEVISKSLLIDWKPHIKDHQVMAGKINLKSPYLLAETMFFFSSGF